MSKALPVIAVLAGWILPITVSAGGSAEIFDPQVLSLLDPKAEVEVVSEGYAWAEGPVWVPPASRVSRGQGARGTSTDGSTNTAATGYLLFSDIPTHRVYRYVPGEGASVYLEDSGYANGLLLDRDNSLLLLQSRSRRVAKLTAPLDTPQPRYTTLAESFEGQRLNSPNDGVLHHTGILYFTDPPYGLPAQLEDPAKELDFQGIYALAPSGELTLLDDSIYLPNGIALSPDQRRLYVAASDPNTPAWYLYELDAHGVPGPRRVFHKLDSKGLGAHGSGLPDGLKVHSSGAVFATGPGGVWVLDEEGKHLATIPTPSVAANLAFNADESAIYITAHKTLLRYQLRSQPVRFTDVSAARGLVTEPTWKYGGPAVADLNGDGRYELLLGNHDKVPAQLVWATGENHYALDPAPLMRWDVHGIAAGDYDLDGDQDVVVALGGGNGSSPQPPRILKNDDGSFVDITEGSGIEHMGARGRSVRWIDMDLDGDLDLLQINAMMIPGETGPRNILFENIGQDQFRYRSHPQFESLDAERVLVTDFNGDNVSDLITFAPLGLWAGDGEFGFEDVTGEWLPKSVEQDFVMAVAEADIDNDGDLDYYLARGKTYYQIANNAVAFDARSRRLDLRDEGNSGQDGISFTADGELQLNHFFHWHRGVKVTLPVYLGEAGVALDTPAGADRVSVSREQAIGFPADLTKNGWYLGHVGDGQWRLEWRLNDNLAWDLRASIHGVTSVTPDWQPQELGVPDLLLRNEGDRFSDASQLLPVQTIDNNWGVATGDFDNDGFEDFFVYRFGALHQRKVDLLLRNRQGKDFGLQLMHGATAVSQSGHGDMGAAFDYDLDGDVDLLSGDDDQGRWHLFENQLQQQKASPANDFLLVNVGYSPKGADASAATVRLTVTHGETELTRLKRVGSGSATHSQSQLNLVHFGLGQGMLPTRLEVVWRDGSQQQLEHPVPGSTIALGERRQ
ncbi:SMP-30/gluconolactonase/LRE family protein [Microbulbifer agarilyticus]|uniref:SMP-30/gluconolactonase/LRE family protein n=1 Tax=Microbulbifer agarilyticus TaxID=260552 RepID=UPI001C967C0D|nr:SMP-30/gluconolactonase/LRE family protein [Microbulbifer agarilyticus]MBY6188928.1 SMP-30/gluconolactonase/LRE family protein [Microbulbifer agarilyticus]